jgi:lipocalin
MVSASIRIKRFEEQSEAQKWLNDALTKKDLGIPTFQTKVSLGEYLGTWLNTVAKPRVSEQTFDSYQWLLNRVITN